MSAIGQPRAPYIPTFHPPTLPLHGLGLLASSPYQQMQNNLLMSTQSGIQGLKLHSFLHFGIRIQ